MGSIKLDADTKRALVVAAAVAVAGPTSHAFALTRLRPKNGRHLNCLGIELKSQGRFKEALRETEYSGAERGEERRRRLVRALLLSLPLPETNNSAEALSLVEMIVAEGECGVAFHG